MQATEADRERIERKLQAIVPRRWVAVESELHRHGKVAPFWFLIDDPGRIAEIIDTFRSVAADDLARFDETKFEVSFVQIANGKKIVWDFVDNEEIRGMAPPRPWGEYPAQFSLREDELFGEYIGKS